MNIEASWREIQRFGARDALAAKALRVLDRKIHIELWRALAVTTPRPELSQVPPGHTAGFLDEATIRRFSRDPAYDLSDAFVDGAFAAGDRCHGIMRGETLVSYSWYSRIATPLDDEVLLHFDPRWVYMFKAFTHPDHRGRKLNGVNITLALARYRAEGAAGMLSYVNASNLASLRSSHGMGQEDLGSLYVLRVLGRCFIHPDKGCVKHGLSAEQAPRPAPPKTVRVPAAATPDERRSSA